MTSSAKKCTLCQIELSLDNFLYDKRRQNYNPRCHKCRLAKKKECRSKPEQKQKAREYAQKRKNNMTAEQKEELKIKQAVRDKKYYEANKDKINKRNNSYYSEKKTEIQLKRKQIRISNREAYRKKINDYLDRNPLIRFVQNLRQRVRRELSTGKEYLNLLGCSKLLAVKWFEYNFELDSHMEMTWENYGKKWWIEHMKPCASFDLAKIEDQKACFNWKNTAPTLVEYNRAKSSKIKVIDLIRQEIRVKQFLKIYSHLLNLDEASSTTEYRKISRKYRINDPGHGKHLEDKVEIILLD